MKDEKIQHNRFKINQMCEIYMGREVYIPIKGVDLSEGGVSFKTEESLAISSIVNFQIALYIGKKSKTIDCEGVVRKVNLHGDSYTGAIEFTGQSASNKKIIHEYVNGK